MIDASLEADGPLIAFGKHGRTFVTPAQDLGLVLRFVRIEVVSLM